jgi:hypothetical protein
METIRPGTRVLVTPAPDAAVAAIVGGWPAAFAATRAPGLGFVRHGDLNALVEEFIAHDLRTTQIMRGL